MGMEKRFASFCRVSCYIVSFAS